MEKFKLVSLREKESKHLANVLANDTSRKILDYLATHSRATETSLSNKLGVPLSTIHYNLKQLMKGGLVKTDEYHYSQKGREVSHYELASQFIVISPHPGYDWKEKLMKVLPMTLVAGGIGWVLQQMQKPMSFAQQIIQPVQTFSYGKAAAGVQAIAAEEAESQLGQVLAERSIEAGASAPVAFNTMPMADYAEPVMKTVIQGASKAVDDVANTTVNITTEAITHINEIVIQPEPIGLYFFVGFLVALGCYLLWDYLNSK